MARMVGTVVTQIMRELEAASVCVIVIDSEIKGVSTVMHMTPGGKFYVSGDYKGEVSGDNLHKLLVRSKDGNLIPLKFNQWKKSIKAGEVNSGKEVHYELQPMKFVEGHYTNECTLCTGYFVGAKRQPVCKGCAEENAVAKIVINKSSKSKARKRQKRKMVDLSTAKLVAIEAYKKGVKGQNLKSVEKWLNKTF